MPISRTRRIGGFLATYGHHLLPAAAAISSLATTWIIVGPVLNRAGDDLYHLLNEYAIARAIYTGDNPFGPLGMEFGQPVLRFYQALFYLNTVGWHLLAGLDLRFVHNATIVVCFALSPFAYAYFLRKLGLGKWTAGLGGFLSLTSVAAFGNSFEAYFEAGIVTQSIGGLFLPWFMGHFIGMLRGENRPSTTALLFAVAFLSHAIVSVFAVFAGALYLAVADVGLARSWKRLAAFSALGIALVAFWALPFIEHTRAMRPIPDSIIRGRGVHWFTSVSTSELSMVLRTGRLLDDPPRMGDARDANDKFMDKISIIGTLKTRPPVLTILTALGALAALTGLRRTSRRFLLVGLTFSLMLFAGPDDFRWLKFLPFIREIQTFRCTYLVEFFAFGLAALGLGAVGRAGIALTATRRHRGVAAILAVLFSLSAAGGAASVCAEIMLLGRAHMNLRNPSDLDEMVDAASSLRRQGYPFRIQPKVKSGITSKVRQAWLAVHGFEPYCTHWKGTGPTAAYHLCLALTGPSRAGALFSLLGARWFIGADKEIEPYVKAEDADHTPIFEKIPNGKGRGRKKVLPLTFLDSGHDHFLRPLLGRPLPVVCSDEAWVWLIKSWLSKYRSALWDARALIPMRVRAGELERSGLLAAADSVLYLDHSRVAEDAPALARAVGRVRVVSTRDIPSVPVVQIGDKSVWTLLSGPKPIPRGSDAELEELDPGLDASEIAMLDLRRKSFQRFVFDVDDLKPVIALLPMEAVPGWSAVLDGRPLPSFAAGPDLVGVYLPSGAHRLELRWDMPMRHLVALLASLSALAAVLGAWAVRGARAIRSARGLR
jgi:hypothetical protein